MFACVKIHQFVRVHMHMCAHECRGLRLTSDIFLHHFPSYIWGTVSSWTLSWPVLFVWLASSIWGSPASTSHFQVDHHAHLSLTWVLKLTLVFMLAEANSLPTEPLLQSEVSPILVHMFHNWEHAAWNLQRPSFYWFCYFLPYNQSLLKIKQSSKKELFCHCIYPFLFFTELTQFNFNTWITIARSTIIIQAINFIMYPWNSLETYEKIANTTLKFNGCCGSNINAYLVY